MSDRAKKFGVNQLAIFYALKKIINFVENGGTITEATHIFGIVIASIYR